MENSDALSLSLAFRITSAFFDIRQYSAELLKLVGDDTTINLLSVCISDLRDYLAEQSKKSP